MPIGKDSITKRVAKQTSPAGETTAPEKSNVAPELVGTVAAAPKAPAKKASTSSATAKKTTSTKANGTASTTKPAAKTTNAKAPAQKKEAPTEAKVNTGVLANVSPETVEKVTGHKENTGFEKVQIGDNLPAHLL